MLVLLIGAIALFESLALIGLLLPGVVLITAAASLAGHQDLAVVTLLLAAFVGAVIGDGLSFILGFTQRERVSRIWRLSRHPDWLARGTRFFRRYGSLSVFLGRFVGPVRPIIPLVAGMLQMRPGAFLWANLISAALWAPTYVLPGYLLGQTWQQLIDIPPGLETVLITLGMVLVVSIITFSWLRYQVSRSGNVYRFIASIARQHPMLRRAWLKQSEQGSEVPLASWLLLIFSLGGLSGLTIAVIGQEGPFALDLEAHAFFASLTLSAPIQTAAEILAQTGDLYGVLALTLPWGIWLLLRRHTMALAHIAAGLGGIALLNALGKALIGRPRPEMPDYLIGSLAYPSGHASAAVVLYGLAAAFVAQELPRRWRFWAYWLAIALTLPMALSRLLIGAHWLTDLLGGGLLGLLVCALVRLAWQRQPRRSLTPCPWQTLAVASLLLLAARVAWLPQI